MNAAQTLAHIRAQIRELSEDLRDGAPRVEVVEAGTALAAIVTSATDALAEIKASLRDDALAELNGESGSVDFDGLEIGRVTVTVPTPKMGLAKGTDPEVIRRRLGDDFDLYFETKTTYAPRKNAAELVLAMATGADKDLLLTVLEENEQTPRVSFRKV